MPRCRQVSRHWVLWGACALNGSAIAPTGSHLLAWCVGVSGVALSMAHVGARLTDRQRCVLLCLCSSCFVLCLYVCRVGTPGSADGCWVLQQNLQVQVRLLIQGHSATYVPRDSTRSCSPPPQNLAAAESILMMRCPTAAPSAQSAAAASKTPAPVRLPGRALPPGSLPAPRPAAPTPQHSVAAAQSG